MVAPGEKSTTTTVLFHSPTLKLLSQHNGTPNEKTPVQLFGQNVKQHAEKVILSVRKQQLFAHHGLRHLQHFSCDSPVRFMMYSEAAAAFISLHSDNTVCLYKAGHRQTLSTCLPFTGLTATKIPGCLVGWGPGPIFTLLDSELRPLDTADNALDIQICEAAEHSTELVTAGAGNVCVWSVMLMRRKLTIQEELQQYGAFTHMTLAPPRVDKPHRGFFVSGQAVTVVDLDGGRVLEHKNDLWSCNITAVTYCSQLDCLIMSSQDLAITVWGPDWEPRVAFLGHNDVVNSLFYCSKLNILVSSSVDCTIRIWNVEDCEAVDCVQTEQKRPPLYIRGTKKGDIFFSFSHRGLDLWAVRNLYTLSHQLGREDAPVRQIAVSQLPAPYPTRVLCISGDCDITFLAEETGAVLTSFKAKERILCADYCLHREILFVLTVAGTVLQANMLSNPITVMQEWPGIGQGPWQRTDRVTKKLAKKLPVPGPACCMVLYSCVADTQKALEEWQSLQEGRGGSHRKYIELDGAKNKFLIIIGQNGGCVSVLKSDSGKVLFRTPAHNGQRVTAMQACPENHYLLSSGEDLTVVVWRVYPYIEECLSQQMSLQCDQPHVHLATVGSQFALTFQEPSSGSYRLKLFNLLNQTDYQPREGHSNHFTGLCGIPELKVFVSSSLDKTLRIWNEENHLIRTLQLHAVPQCLAYSQFGGQLYLGIRGDLYKMRFAKFLPHNYRERLNFTHCAEPLPDIPIPVDKETHSQTNPPKDEEHMFQAIANNRVMIGGMQQQESLVTSNMDLEALFQSSVKCHKGKPPSTKQTKKEAFYHYMNIIYGLPPINKTEIDDIFDPSKYSVYTERKYVRPRNLPKKKQDVRPQSKKEIPVNVEKKKKRKPPKTPTEDLSPPVEKVTPKKPVMVKKPVRVEKTEKPVAEIIKPVEPPKPRTPTPPRPRTPTPPPTMTLPLPLPPPPTPIPIPTPTTTPTPPPSLPPPPPQEPSPEVPTFHKQFAEMEWFSDLYPDKKVPDDLSAEDFSLQLLNCLQTCCTTSKVTILVAIWALHQQRLLHNTDELHAGLIDSLQKFARPHMSAVERSVLTEMLNLLVHLKSEIGYNLMIKILTLLAYQELDLRNPVLRLLRAVGVDQAEQWLWPELESWESELLDQSNTWESLHGKADRWFALWIFKFKEYNKHLGIKKFSAFTKVDVLNYFCRVRKEEYRKVACLGRKDTVILPLHECSFKPILRLGETYSMSRIRRPPGIILPPLQKRPFLMHFPNFITLPLPRVTLRPFQVYSEEDWLRTSVRRYFIQQQSLVEYYRQCLKH